eukprot:CAMPEP_0201488686 /NCGR_PEP_ID=MMETSP0151_2-20130828/19322_1 /ASSEMBLY_ACC=CAM_ASM_000257 /TAXON_ID=200890 /ORGANISM="Paramoeba atlantica, Strain 621/1 / CCAP 1560/9" /LENGTH=358 /DNA_ID=CAMNT_0047874037 /DNA_START=31 /DNA_END=1107 /DNA_ORIENTATION=+
MARQPAHHPSFWVFFTLLFFVVSTQGLQLAIQNHCPHPVAIFWDSFGSGPDSKGLIPMGEIQPFKIHSINTHPSHTFEVQNLLGQTIDLIQAGPAPQQEFELGPTRDCNAFGVEELLGQTSSYSTLELFHFRRVGLSRRRERQTLQPLSSVMVQRAENERRRIWLNENQPKMTPKFTEVGYGKTRLPEFAWNPLINFWNENKQKMQPEGWKPQDHHVNHWESPTYVLPVPNHVRTAIIKAVQPILEEWIGGETPLEFTSLYGVRIYKNNSYLLNHVDRSATHAVSAIIQVDQKVDEDWMLEVLGHDEKVNHLTLSPAEMILYESASVVHGRPEKFQGDFYANTFVHFRPKNNWNLEQL